MGDQLERTVEVVAELRQVLVEGRQLLKDLRHERKQAEKGKEAAHRFVRELMADGMSERVEQELGPILNDLVPLIEARRDETVERFDRTIEEYLNVARTGRKDGKGPDVFEEYAQEVHARRNELLRLRRDVG